MSLAHQPRHAPSLRVEVRLESAAQPLLAAAVALIVLATARVVIGPGPAPLSYDAYATVVHFDHLVSGRFMEAALGTTPKPLLTLAFGLAHALGGWGAVEAVSILAWVASTVLAALLAARLGGALAGLFVGCLLGTSSTLALEAAWGLGTVWAIGIWAMAGLAVTAPSPRWRTAGFLLGLATLVRLETVLLVGVWLAIVIGRRVAGRTTPRAAMAGAVLALWWLPVMLLHDALLSGDPLLWTRVSSDYGRALASLQLLPGPGQAADLATSALTDAPVRAVAALLGAVVLARRRCWPILVGLATLGLGVQIALPVLAGTGRLADARYLEPVRVAMALSAGLGAAWLVRWLAAAVADRWRRLPAWSPQLAAAALLGAVLLGQPMPSALDAATHATVDRFRSFGRSAELALPAMRRIVAVSGPVFRWPGLHPLSDRHRLDVFAVSGNLRPRLAVDLGIPLTRIVATEPLTFCVREGRPEPGEVVLHSRGDQPEVAFAPVERSEPSLVGPALVVPLVADEQSGTWLVRLDTAGGAPLTAPVAR